MDRDLFRLALIAVAGYVAYRIVQRVALDPIADTIAEPIIKAILPGKVDVKGAALLPDGQSIPMSQLTVTKVPNREEFRFVYRGKTYQLLPRQGDNWPAKLLF